MQKQIKTVSGALSYRIAGKGTPVMLIHGLAEDGSIWNEITAAVGDQALIISPDLPGSGASERGAEKITIEGMAVACKAIIDAENISSVVVIGHSMGGYVSLAFAEQFPQAIIALGLFHSSAYADDEEKKSSRNKMISFIQSHGTLPFLKQATPGLFSDTTKAKDAKAVDELIERYSNFDPQSLVAYQQAMIERPDRTSLLENIVKPVLFVIGRQDKAIPYDVSIRQSHIPSVAYIHVLEDSGHMGMLEETSKSIEILKSFLSDLK